MKIRTYLYNDDDNLEAKKDVPVVRLLTDFEIFSLELIGNEEGYNVCEITGDLNGNFAKIIFRFRDVKIEWNEFNENSWFVDDIM